MHLMVLGASRHMMMSNFDPKKVSMHLMVLGASRPTTPLTIVVSCLVSMHLMVLGASRLVTCARNIASTWESQCT